MRLTFRVKLMSIAGIAALAFLLLIVASALIAKRVETQLATIQDRYLPKLALEPELDGTFETLARAFQDAVAAHDREALTATAQIKSDFLAKLTAARDVVQPGEAAALRSALNDYYAAAYDVSRRILADETGEPLVDAIAGMQTKQARVSETLKAAAKVDRVGLTRAFAAASEAENTAGLYRLVISIACLASVGILSVWVGRGVLHSLADLTAGFQRFGRGELEEPIPVVGHDELADVALRANEMAGSLDRSRKEKAKTEEALKLSNRELEAFSYSVAHDLRAPLRGINGFSRALLEDHSAALDDEAKDYLNRVVAGADRMGELIDALLALSRITRAPLRREPVNMSRLAEAVIKQLRASDPDRVVEFVNQEGLVAHGDPPLLRALLDNLLGNAWKFTSTREGARIAFGCEKKDASAVYTVEDNGAGFDMAYVAKLFAPFQRLHSASDFAGTGIGLATVQRIVHRHGGRIWADGAVGRGATFHFTLVSAPIASAPGEAP